MSQKMKFVERAAEGEPVARLCAEFGVSRDTGHRWIRRFEEGGYEGLVERSRRPHSTPLATAEDVVLAVLEARRAHPSWGPKKLVVVLARKLQEHAPSERTIARILRRAELVRARRRRRPLSVVDDAPCAHVEAPNDVWSLDFKGWWRTRDGQRCDPFTIRDAFSRFILDVRICPQTTDAARRVLERLFAKHGIPGAIQCDNGTPFISVRSRGGLSALSTWLVSLGITIVRSRPATPQDNGGHERMHLDIRREVQARSADTLAAQQRALDKWRHEFNHVRPHEALKQKTPAEIYKPMRRATAAAKPKPYTYPPTFTRVQVSGNGSFSLRGEKYFLARALAGHDVGLERVSHSQVRVWFHNVDLQLLDLIPDVDDAVFFEATSGVERAAE